MKFSEAPPLMALHPTDRRGRSSDSPARPAAREIQLLSQVVNGGVFPFVLIFMLLLINKKELMRSTSIHLI